ncbi:MAG: thymidine kinase [Cellulosilyticaceae bacterium]
MHSHYIDIGRLEIICGPMFSGKSEELIRRLKRTILAKKNTVIFTPQIDNRYLKDHICSHDGKHLEAIPVTSIEEILNHISSDTQVIGIDEVQFLQGDTVRIIMQLVEDGKRVICAGLDKDFKAESFGCMPELLALADEVTKLTAICMSCGRPANFTQRLIEGRPASYNDPLILIGASESYEARCRVCYHIDK